MSEKKGGKGGKGAAKAAAAPKAKSAVPKGDACHIRTRKMISNKLLSRKQMIVDVAHFGRGSVPKVELQAKLAKMFKVKDPKQVVLYGFKIAFGGGKSSGFALVYDDVAAAKKYEPRYRLIRAGLAVKKEGSAKQKKEKKNRLKKLRGKEKAAKA